MNWLVGGAIVVVAWLALVLLGELAGELVAFVLRRLKRLYTPRLGPYALAFTWLAAGALFWLAFVA